MFYAIVKFEIWTEVIKYKVLHLKKFAVESQNTGGHFQYCHFRLSAFYNGCCTFFPSFHIP